MVFRIKGSSDSLGSSGFSHMVLGATPKVSVDASPVTAFGCCCARTYTDHHVNRNRSKADSSKQQEPFRKLIYIC